MYKAAYGNLANSPVPVRLAEFSPDTQMVSQGVQVGIGNWQATLENNKNLLAADFVTRFRFTAAYPQGMPATEFVERMFANAGVAPSASDRQGAINEFGSSTNSGDVAARARVLRRVVENPLFAEREFNRAFVLMQYFGYLRRNPNDTPDSNFSGYNFWLSKLNDFSGNFVNAEMVKAFTVSNEYRRRFGN
jgi:hypothetical protein